MLNAKCVLLLDTKLDCLKWVKEQLKVMLKAKRIVRDWLFFTQSSHTTFAPLPIKSADSPGSSSTSICSSALDKFVVPEAAKDAYIRRCLKIWCPVILIF